MKLTEQDVKEILMIYKDLRPNDVRRSSRGSSFRIPSDEARELSSDDPTSKEHKNKMYQLTIVETLDWSFEGVTRLNHRTSNENIAHIVLRNHEREFEWNKIPFRPRFYIYNEVWKRMCDKAEEWKNKIKDEWELFDRYDNVLS